MKLRLSKRVCLTTAGILLTLFIAYLLLLSFPQPLFRWSVASANLILYSDNQFSDEEGKRILELVAAKLAASPLSSAELHHSVFVCNAHWRQLLFFNTKYGVGGVNYYPLTTNVFLSGALIKDNRLISPSGHVVQDRTLDFFITHEITHSLVKKAAGVFHHLRLPEYVREGYPDYVAKGNDFQYEEARQAFLANAPEMDRWHSGLYLRYHLLVAHLLEKENWTVQRFLTDPPEQSVVEDAVRRGR